MLHDPKFWLSISFCLFCVLFIKFLLPIINQKITKSIQDINNKLDDLSNKKADLENEIKKLTIQKKQMQDYQEKLIEDAKIEIENLQKNSELELKEIMSRENKIFQRRLNDEKLKLVTSFKEEIVNDLVKDISVKIDNVEYKDKILSNILQKIK